MKIYSIIFFLLFPSMIFAQNLNDSAKQAENSAAFKPAFNFLNEIEDVKAPAEFDPFKTELNYPTLYGLGALYLGSGIYVHYYQANAWWKDNRTSFHFQNDNEYALLIDKVGHFYGGILLAHVFSAGLEGGNIQSETAAIWGSSMSLAFQMYVEIQDGFGPDWGFSPSDAIADVLGAGYALGQYYFPYLKNFQFRLSYLPSDKQETGRGKRIIFDDYEGQKYWLALRMKNLLPDAAAKYWPSFLMISAGVGVKDLTPTGGGYREYFIALDIDADEIPLYGKFWQFVKNSLNYFHFPMPGVRITPDAAFFVICF